MLRTWIAVALLALLVSCGGSKEGSVEMLQSSQFEPATLTITIGETVTWTNSGSEPHTVTAYEDKLPDGAEFFSSGGDDEASARDDPQSAFIDGGDSFEVTFNEPGRYEYFCIPHESLGMRGTIVVES